MTPDRTAPRRILVMMLGDVGDVLLATPALRRLRSRYPDAHVTAMTKPSTVAVLDRSGLIDAFLPIDKHTFDHPGATLRPSVALGLLRFVRDLRGRRFDTVIVLHHLVTWWGTIKFALLALASGAPRRVGLDNGRGVFLTHVADDESFDAAQEATYWLRVVDALSRPPSSPRRLPRLWRLRRRHTVDARACRPATTAPTDAPPPVFVVPAEAHTRAAVLLGTVGRVDGARLLAIHPGSGAYSVARRWFPERFAATADALAQRHGLTVVLVGNESERDLAADVIARMHVPALNLAGQTSLDDLAAVLRRCALLVGNDSGVAHLASAVGTPVVAIFGPFNHRTWHPLGRSIAVHADPELPCMPCANRGFARGYPEGCPPRYCLQEVTPAMVLGAAERLLAGMVE